MAIETARILQSHGLSANREALAARELGVTDDTERPVVGTSVGGSKYIGTEDVISIVTAAPAAINIMRTSFTRIMCDSSAAGSDISLDIRAGAQVLGYICIVSCTGPGTRKTVVTYATGATAEILDNEFRFFIWDGTAWKDLGYNASFLHGLPASAFAFSGLGEIITSGNIIASISKSGMYTAGIDVAGMPYSSTWQVFANYYNSTNWTLQAHDLGTKDVYHIELQGGVIGTWKKFWDSENDGPTSGMYAQYAASATTATTAGSATTAGDSTTLQGNTPSDLRPSGANLQDFNYTDTSGGPASFSKIGEIKTIFYRGQQGDADNGIYAPGTGTEKYVIISKNVAEGGTGAIFPNTIAVLDTGVAYPGGTASFWSDAALGNVVSGGAQLSRASNIDKYFCYICFLRIV